jgi:hypothetical protein
MTLPELCVRRPVMTSLLMLSFVVFGLFGYRQLPVSALPRVDFPTVAVTATLPGASPDTMASSVAGPLERAFATIPGINMMTSSSVLGRTDIVMQFDLGRDIDGAALDVQSNISATLRKLPPQLPSPPSFRKINPADSPILFIALASTTTPNSSSPTRSRRFPASPRCWCSASRSLPSASPSIPTPRRRAGCRSNRSTPPSPPPIPRRRSAPCSASGRTSRSTSPAK